MNERTNKKEISYFWWDFVSKLTSGLPEAITDCNITYNLMLFSPSSHLESNSSHLRLAFRHLRAFTSATSPAPLKVDIFIFIFQVNE